MCAEELDSELSTVLEEIEAMGVPAWHELSVESARRIENELFTTNSGPEMDLVRDLGFDAGNEVPVRVYRPIADRPLPILVYYHGGGWVLGTLDSIESICRELAARAECIVVSVDYRLAPEHPFPAAVEDAYAALRWVSRNANDLGGDGRVAVGGTSAGGTLAAVTAVRIREEDDCDIDLVRQLLLYPITEYTFNSDGNADRENDDEPLLTRADVEWFWDNYLRSSVDGYNPLASPLRTTDLSGVAPATVVTAGSDPLCEEGAAYANRLADSDVDVEYLHYPAMTHGFLSLADRVTAADEAMDEVAANIW
jgi:acetyl esterase